MSTIDGHPVAETVDDLTPAWLTGALRSAGVEATVTAVDAERVGTGQIGTSYRLVLTYDGPTGAAPASLVAKLAGGDEAARARVKDGYRQEVGFYTQVAATVDVRTPRCWYGAITDDDMHFTLLLDDLTPARPGVQADGCSVAQAADAVRNLAGLHAPRWNDGSLYDAGLFRRHDADGAAFLAEILRGATGEFVERYESRLGADDVATLEASAEAIGRWQLARPEPFTLLHGDYRLDNLMFPLSGDGVVALDWQTATVGPPGRDLGYFLGNSLEIELRRTHEKELVAEYHQALVARGVDRDFSACFDDYRLGQLQGPMITVLGAIYATAERSDRADGMFLAMATRSCAAIRDLESLSLL